jgi:hypothetical protein
MTLPRSQFFEDSTVVVSDMSFRESGRIQGERWWWWY